MVLKKLWYAVPLLAFWFFYFIGYAFITPHPFSDWYGIPLLWTMILLLAVIAKISHNKAT